ncbi:hypothetical protein SDC9_139033 [bioreactor metagenome]|uniref:Uncharacterized protein n=1 Tax=bioreactor metagenome TaxID=1076179 RepID=A0A645DRL5_9ZZZZ
MALSYPIATAARAPGKMKIYELTLGVLQLSIFFVSWVVLKMGYPAYAVFIVAIAVNVIMFFVRLFIVSNLIDLSKKLFMLNVVFPVMSIVFFSTITSNFLQRILPKGLVYSIIVIIFSIMISAITMFYIGVDSHWRKKIRYNIKIKAKKNFKFRT